MALRDILDQFHKKFMKFFFNLFRGVPWKLGALKNNEPIARFIFSRSHFSQQAPKYGAFMPAANGETSVFRTIGLDDLEIWKLGDFIGEKRGKSPKALAVISVDAVREQVSLAENQLVVQVDARPHFRHANIIGWPESKSQRQLVAIELARIASLSLAVSN